MSEPGNAISSAPAFAPLRVPFLLVPTGGNQAISSVRLFLIAQWQIVTRSLGSSSCCSFTVNHSNHQCFVVLNNFTHIWLIG